MKRSAKAHWQGGLKRGAGFLNTDSGALKNVRYTFSQRFENEKGTNPEELIGAAHAGCFSMFMAGELEKRGIAVESLDTTADVSLEKKANVWEISQIHLRVSVIAPGATAKQLDEIASFSKDNCPVSKLLRAAISLELHMPKAESVAPQSMI